MDRKIVALQESIKILEPAYAQPALATAVMSAFGLPFGVTTNIGELMKNVGVDLGLTESVRQVLRTRPKERLRPTEIRDLLVQNKVDLPPTNPLSSIHTVLKRIAESDPQFTTGLDDGGSWYQFDATIPRPPRRRFARARASQASEENE